MAIRRKLERAAHEDDAVQSRKGIRRLTHQMRNVCHGARGNQSDLPGLMRHDYVRDELNGRSFVEGHLCRLGNWRAAEAVIAMNMKRGLRLAGEGFGCAASNGDFSPPGRFQHTQHVVRGVLQRGVAGDSRDAENLKFR